MAAARTLVADSHKSSALIDSIHCLKKGQSSSYHKGLLQGDSSSECCLGWY